MSPDLALSQSARLSGIVTDGSDGRPLEGATVTVLTLGNGEIAHGAATDGDGIYLIVGIEPGEYALAISFIGFETFRDTISFASNDVLTRTVALGEGEGELNEVVVQSERTEGMARVTGGHQRISPEDVELIPSPDISGDLSNYLSTLPSVVSSGDRGGQFFVRGGEPSQNLVLLDGITIYQPFHVLGFYSAFPSDIVDHVDMYAGGFGPKYSGRLSSVIDVASRSGNNRRFAGMGSISPFGAAGRLEGPVIPGLLSFIGSGRRSLVDRSGEYLYKEPMPLEFGDVFGKLNFVPSTRSTFSATGLHTFDRGELVPEVGETEAQEVRWTNDGLGLRWLALPHALPVSTEFLLSHARHTMQQGTASDTARQTEVRECRIALNATFFGNQTTTLAGWEVVFGKAQNDLGGKFQNLDRTSSNLFSYGFYVEPAFIVGDVHVHPGARLQFFNIRPAPYIEPRLRLFWERGIHHISAATGLYQQQIVGLTDRRDPANVFTAWTAIPRKEVNLGQGDQLLGGRVGRAIHVLLGYRATPLPWLEVSIESFYKSIENLFVGEWTGYPRLSTRLQPAEGRSFGFETRVEFNHDRIYGYVTYGYSNTEYAANSPAVDLWYGEEKLRYRPGHDRRHKVNVLLASEWRGFDVSLRWTFGSGFPYTRPLGFDGFALVDDTKSAWDLEHSRRALYERPFNAVLPTYHRMDVAIERTFSIGLAEASLQASAINAYNRRNLFYVDAFTLERKDQLPFIPSVGLQVSL
ncbi:MAG: TonB-dependent receptor [Rhodothermales bacterium]